VEFFRFAVHGKECSHKDNDPHERDNYRLVASAACAWGDWVDTSPHSYKVLGFCQAFCKRVFKNFLDQATTTSYQ
jgi:hypothetical protein